MWSNSNEQADPHAPPTSAAFTTAAGRKTTISTEAMAKAKALFAGIADDVTAERDVAPRGAPSSGFMTAGGQTTTVSADAVAKAQRLFSDLDAESSSAKQFNPGGVFGSGALLTPTPFVGAFTTAGGSRTSVSAEAMTNAKRLFATIDEQSSATAAPPQGLSGFVTAGGQTTNVSAKALAKAKTLFSDLDGGVSGTPWRNPRGGGGPSSAMPASKSSNALVATTPLLRRPSVPKRRMTDTFSTPFRAPRRNADRGDHVVPSVPSDRFLLPCSPRADASAADGETTSPTFGSSLQRNISVQSADTGQQLPLKRKLQLTDDGSGTQADVVDNSRRHCIKPMPGRLLSLRRSVDGRRLTLPIQTYLAGQRPECYSDQQLCAYGVFPEVIAVTASNAVEFSFSADSLATLNYTDGEQTGVGFDDIYKLFLNMEGVNVKWVTRAWTLNHYRWIVWKLACYEHGFPIFFARCQLTPSRILDQLKYRYDCEVDNCLRSAIKLIAEGDDTASKPMILCVSSIEHSVVDSASGCTVMLTDGWYEIAASFDRLLTQQIQNGFIGVGTKLLLANAKLERSGDACDPLTLSKETTRLVVELNGVRRARWHARLGFLRLRRTVSFSLRSLIPGGGVVPAVRLVIARVYPIIFAEKRASGSTIYRTQKQEELAATEFERETAKAIEKIYEEAMKETVPEGEFALSQADSQSEAQCSQQPSGEHLYNMLRRCDDPTSSLAALSSSQRRSLEAYRCSAIDRRQSEWRDELNKTLQKRKEEIPQRSVSSQLKVRVVEYRRLRNRVEPCDSCILTVYNLSSDVESTLKEGDVVCARNLLVVETRNRGINFRTTDDQEETNRLKRMQLIANRKSHFERINVDAEALWDCFEERCLTSFSRLKSPTFRSPPWNEIDIVGCVVSIRQDRNADVVYLCDDKYDFVAIRFWGPLKENENGDLLTRGSVVALCNVRWFPLVGSTIPHYRAMDVTTVSCNPKEAYLREGLDRLKMKDGFADEAHIRLMNRMGLKTSTTSDNVSRTTLCEDNRLRTPLGESSAQPLNHTPSSVKLKSSADRLDCILRGGLSSSDSPSFFAPFRQSPAVIKGFKPPLRSDKS